MKYIYIVSILLLLYSFMRIKKSKKKYNLILWIAISIIIFMAFNSVIIFILSICGIKSTLIKRSIINIFVSIILIVIGRNKHQKYLFDIKDLYPILIIVFITFIIGLFRFGNYISLDFEITDAVVHFDRAKIFSETNTLLEYTTKHNYMYESYKGNITMFFSYTNLGTMFQLFGSMVDEYKLYQIFIFFELFSYFIGGILFYFIIKNNKSSIKNQIYTCILISLYLLGYPLVNLIYGFHYWGLYLIILEVIIILLREYKDNYNKYLLFVLPLLLFSIFSSYYMMVPVVYGSIGLYLLYLWKFKHIKLKKSIQDIVIILIIPFVIGMLYFIILPTSGKVGESISSFSITGSNYTNILGNFIFLIPILVFYIKNSYKKKDISFESILFILSIIFTIILFIFMFNIKVSLYYYSKIYNLLWILMYIYIAKSLYKNENSFVYIIISIYLILAILSIFKVDTFLKNKCIDIEDTEIISKIANVYDNNADYLLKNNYIISEDTYKLMLYVMDNYNTLKNERGELPFVATYFQKLWICEMYNIIPSNNYSSKNQFYQNNIELLEGDNSTKFVVWIYNEKSEDKLDLNKYNIIYQNDAGYVLEKNY